MSHDAMIPPNVTGQDAELLRRAYALTSQEEGAELYREWAATYDRTMIDGLGYVSPRRLASLFANHVEWRDRAVLDIGCGTGLIGAELGGHGFLTIDGLDLSAEMMAAAAERGLYRRFVTADLNQPLEIENDSYAALICGGTFTSGHVGAGCLDELVRILRPGGTFACAVHHAVWEAFGFDTAFARLVEAGALEPTEIVESPFYESSSATDGRLCVFLKPV